MNSGAVDREGSPVDKRHEGRVEKERRIGGGYEETLDGFLAWSDSNRDLGRVK